jgi:hypothetical protein
METIDFNGIFDRAKAALETLDAQIANLEEELAKAHRERNAAVQVYNAVAPIVDQLKLPSAGDPFLPPPPGPDALKTVGISVAIRYVLESHIEEDFTPAEMRDRLAQSGWNWQDYKNPLATVYTTLVRLAESEKAKATTKDGKKAFYSAKRRPATATPPEMETTGFDAISRAMLELGKPDQFSLKVDGAVSNILKTIESREASAVDNIIRGITKTK